MEMLKNEVIIVRIRIPCFTSTETGIPERKENINLKALEGECMKMLRMVKYWGAQ